MTLLHSFCSLASRLAHVVGTTSLDDGSADLLLLELVLSGGVPLESKVANNVLDVGLVHRKLGTSQRLDLLAAPRDEHKLGALALLVAGNEANESELDLVILELALELAEIARASALQNDLCGAIIAKQSPAREISPALIEASQQCRVLAIGAIVCSDRRTRSARTRSCRSNPYELPGMPEQGRDRKRWP